MTIETISQPSRSKGWSRYSLTASGSPVVTSQTGNSWISGTRKEAEVADGTALVLTSQVSLMVGQGGRRREVLSTEEYLLVAEAGQVVEIEHRPGSQGQTIRVEDARLVEVQ